MLRTRLLTAAIAIPALWLIIEFVPPWRPPWGAALFVGFILAVTAAGLHEYFAMALPEHAFERAIFATQEGLGQLGEVEVLIAEHLLQAVHQSLQVDVVE